MSNGEAGAHGSLHDASSTSEVTANIGTQQASDANQDEAKDNDGNPQHVGRALRTAYQSIMDEDIPDEMLDLLNKLG